MLFYSVLSSILFSIVCAKSMNIKSEKIIKNSVLSDKNGALKPEKVPYVEPDCYGGPAPNTHFVKLPTYLWNYGLYSGCRTSQVNIRQGSLTCDFRSQSNVTLAEGFSSEDVPFSIRPKFIMFPQDTAYYECVNHYVCTKCEYRLLCDDCGWMDINDVRNCNPWRGPGCQENDLFKRRMS